MHLHVLQPLDLPQHGCPLNHLNYIVNYIDYMSLFTTVPFNYCTELITVVKCHSQEICRGSCPLQKYLSHQYGQTNSLYRENVESNPSLKILFGSFWSEHASVFHQFLAIKFFQNNCRSENVTKNYRLRYLYL